MLLRGGIGHLDQHGVLAGHTVALKHIGTGRDKGIELSLLCGLHVQTDVCKNMLAKLKGVDVQRVSADHALFFQPVDTR